MTMLASQPTTPPMMIVTIQPMPGLLVRCETTPKPAAGQ
jgi:hypothetical protein